jgi:hypothetical protein
MCVPFPAIQKKDLAGGNADGGTVCSPSLDAFDPRDGELQGLAA